MASLCVVIFLFSYANATMFWHGHMITVHYWIYHSHIAGKAHRSAPLDKAHTSAELQLIQTVDQISVTDDVISDCEVVPYRNVVETVYRYQNIVAIHIYTNILFFVDLPHLFDIIAGRHIVSYFSIVKQVILSK